MPLGAGVLGDMNPHLMCTGDPGIAQLASPFRRRSWSLTSARSQETANESPVPSQPVSSGRAHSQVHHVSETRNKALVRPHAFIPSQSSVH